MINNNFLKELILKHFVQIFIGIALYFYYVGYTYNLFISRSLYNNLLFESNTTDNIAAGILGFLIFAIILGIAVCFYELLRFLFNKFGKRRFIKFVSLLIYLFGLNLVDKIIIVNFNKLLIEILFSAIFGISILFLVFGFKKLISNKLFLSLILISSIVFLLFYPFILYGILLPSNTLNETLAQINSTVLTSRPLELPSEQKTPFGYLNKLTLVKYKNEKGIFIDPLSKQIIILKDEDIIRIAMPLCRDPLLEKYKNK